MSPKRSASSPNSLELPAGYSLDWSGQYEYMVRAQERLAVVGPITLAVIVLLLFINFGRFAEVAIVMGTLPLALVGGLWLLYLLGYELSRSLLVSGSSRSRVLQSRSASSCWSI